MKPFLATILLLLLTRFAVSAQSPAAPDAPTAIRAVLAAQAAAWNRGDVAAYMAAGYWQSDSLLFIGASGPTRGYAATLARYRQRYATAAQMGHLTFAGLDVRVLSPTSAFVVGQWALHRPGVGDLSGAFTLLLRQVRGQWLIVVDHSS